MNHAALLLPVFVQVLLTFALMGAMGRARVAALRSGALRVRDIALGQSAWPAQATQFERAYLNQFELPVLFYAVVAMLLATNLSSTLFVVLAWLFVLTRLAHAFIHVTSNIVPQRFGAFLIGGIILMLMWAAFALRLFIGAI